MLTLLSRVAKLENGQCIIGMKKLAMIPLIAFDLIVNVGLASFCFHRLLTLSRST